MSRIMKKLNKSIKVHGVELELDVTVTKDGRYYTVEVWCDGIFEANFTYEIVSDDGDKFNPPSATIEGFEWTWCFVKADPKLALLDNWQDAGKEGLPPELTQQNILDVLHEELITTWGQEGE